jgi:hypothetical protein
LAFASHLDRIDAEHRADAAGKPVDGIAVADVDGRRDSVLIRVSLGADGREAKARDARLIEKAAKGGMHVAGIELQKKHGATISHSVYLY